MNVVVAGYQAISILHGGPNTQVRDTVKHLAEWGVHATFFDSWAPLVPKDKLVVAESGLSRREDIALLAKADVTTFLIGEGLMRRDDIAAATASLIGAKLRR